jgi:hypothetical protein
MCKDMQVTISRLKSTRAGGAMRRVRRCSTLAGMVRHQAKPCPSYLTHFTFLRLRNGNSESRGLATMGDGPETSSRESDRPCLELLASLSLACPGNAPMTRHHRAPAENNDRGDRSLLLRHAAHTHRLRALSLQQFNATARVTMRSSTLMKAVIAPVLKFTSKFTSMTGRGDMVQSPARISHVVISRWAAPDMMSSCGSQSAEPT